MQVGDACPACANGILKHGAVADDGADRLRCEPAFTGERSCGGEWTHDGDDWTRVDSQL
jgi:hypothetical protein